MTTSRTYRGRIFSLPKCRRSSLSWSAVCLFAVTLLLSGCQLRPLVDPEYGTLVNIRINTDGIRNITSDIYNDAIPVPEIAPDVMHVLFYDTATRSLVTESFVSEKSTDGDGYTTISGRVSLVPGTYHIVSYDFGTESTIVDGHESFDMLHATSGSVSETELASYSSKAQDGSIVYTPDHLVVSTDREYEIPYHNGIHVIETEASTIVETYYLQIKVDGLEYVSSARAFLSGMSGSSSTASGDAVDQEGSTIYFTLQKSEDNGVPVICNIFNCFGRIPDAENDLSVTFDIRTSDGRTVTREFDITDLFESEACINHNWLLLEETITIDPPQTTPGTGGGFDPEVGDWEDENHEIEI